MLFATSFESSSLPTLPMNKPVFTPLQIENWADSLSQQHYVLIEHFLSPQEAQALRSAIDFHREEANFHKAGIGKMLEHQVVKEVRGDYVKWIEEGEALPATRAFLQKLKALAEAMSEALRLSLQDYECHFAIYPPGSYYEAHYDQFRSDGNRVLSLACYLNPHWEMGQGGELKIYPPDQEPLALAPLMGRLVLFRSDSLLHEVLPTQVDRYSITGWLLQRPRDLPFGI